MRALTIETWGVRARLECDSSFVDGLDRLLLPTWKVRSDAEKDPLFRLYRDEDGFPAIDSPPLEILASHKSNPWSAFERRLHLYLATHARGCVYVHAGVVKWNGSALIFPGRTWSGKSTLVRALIEGGAIYMSDEYAIVDADGMVYPFPRALSLRNEDGSKDVRVVDSLEMWDGDSSPVPLGGVFCLSYKKGSPWSVKPVSQGEALLSLIANTVSARAKTVLAIECFRRSLQRQGLALYAGVRAEAAEASRYILSLLTA